MLCCRYTSKVFLKKPQLVRSTVSDSTLFDHLDSTWSMKPGPQPNTTWLSFKVDFAFRSPLYKHIADVFFAEVQKQMMKAFEGRCRRLYGPSQMARPAKQHKPHQVGDQSRQPGLPAAPQYSIAGAQGMSSPDVQEVPAGSQLEVSKR